jgi:Zn-finger nucleic acid-binding protein
MDDAVERYHEHLDKCARCREYPFDQCPIGNILLSIAGTAAIHRLARQVQADEEEHARHNHREKPGSDV